MEQIPITRPLLDEKEREYLERPLNSGWLVQGSLVQELEEKVAEFTGARFAVAVNSCTSALMLTAIALGLEAGDEVIVPSFTWISTATSIEITGARPVFADISLENWNIDPLKIKDKLSSATKAILPVHLFGVPAPIEEVKEIAADAGALVYEDCACSLGTRVGGRHSGTFGIAGCFSFHPRKSITTGEGGIVITDDETLAETIRSLREHGADRSDWDREKRKDGLFLPEYVRAGFNMRMTDIQAAIGLAQWEKLPFILEQRRERAARYEHLLREREYIEVVRPREGEEFGYQAYVCLLEPQRARSLLADKDQFISEKNELSRRRDSVMRMMAESGIATRPGTHCAALQKYYRVKYGVKEEDFPAGFIAQQCSITLPLFPQMTDEQQKRVVETLDRVVKNLGIKG